MKTIRYCFLLIVINTVTTINPTNAQYNPTVFQGSSIRPRMGDVSILANSLREREDRQTLALEAYNELQQVITNKRKELPFNPNRSLEICKPAFLMTVIRKSSSYIAV